jgi:benzoyl-CoA reductase subunit C
MTTVHSLEQLTATGRASFGDWPAHYPDRRAMGYLCSYLPAEIIHAAGLTPVRVRGNTAPLRQVDAHLQSFTCALCRSTLDQLLSGGLGFLAGTAFAHTCDTMQALADLWRINSKSDHFVHVVMQPTSLDSPAAHAYLVVELARFRDRLAAFVGHPITDDDLRTSITLFDEARRLVQELQQYRDRLNATDFFAILDAAQVMPREQFNPLLAELLVALDTVPPRSGSPGLFLTGAVLDEPHILELIDDLGARVVGDDLCSGSRHFHDRVGAKGDPIGALASYFLRRPPCPAKLQPQHDPGSYLLNQARTVRADGVVFVLEKFCDPHAFDRALALRALDNAGISHLLLEVEQSSSLEALRTRLQAFAEML